MGTANTTVQPLEDVHLRVVLDVAAHLYEVIKCFAEGADLDVRLFAVVKYLNYLRHCVAAQQISAGNCHRTALTALRVTEETLHSVPAAFPATDSAPNGRPRYVVRGLEQCCGNTVVVPGASRLDPARKAIAVKGAKAFYIESYRLFIQSTYCNDLVLYETQDCLCMTVPVREFSEDNAASLHALALLLRVPDVPSDYMPEVHRLAENFVHRLPKASLVELFRGDYLEMAGCANLQAVCGAYIRTTP